MKQLPLNALAGRLPGADRRAGPILPSTVIVHDLAVYGRSAMVLATWRQQALSRSRSRSSIVGGRLRNGRSMRPRRLGPHGGEPDP